MNKYKKYCLLQTSGPFVLEGLEDVVSCAVEFIKEEEEKENRDKQANKDIKTNKTNAIQDKQSQESFKKLRTSLAKIEEIQKIQTARGIQQNVLREVKLYISTLLYFFSYLF